jgi:N-methylhydantoinase A
VRVPVASGAVDLAAVEAAFHTEHRRKYTFALEDTPIELVTFHLATHRRAAKPELAPWRGGAASPEPKGRRRVDFDVDGVHETPVLERDDLPSGWAAEGPLVIEEETTTGLIHPGQAVEIDHYGNLVIAVGGGNPSQTGL